MPAAALAKMVRGVSCRDYEAVVDTARAGFGVNKSSVSRNFVEATREQVAAFAERRFDETTFAAVFVDAHHCPCQPPENGARPHWIPPVWYRVSPIFPEQ